MVCGDYVLASGSTQLRNHKNLVVLNWGAKSLRINLAGKYPRCLQRCCFIPQTCGHMGGSYNGGIQITHVGVSIQLDGTLNGKSREKKETHSFCGSPRYPNSKKTHCPGQVAGQPLWKDPSVPSPGTQVAGKFMEDFSDGKPETKMFIMSDWDYYSQNMEN